MENILHNAGIKFFVILAKLANGAGANILQAGGFYVKWGFA